MKITRRQLRKLILQEITLNEAVTDPPPSDVKGAETTRRKKDSTTYMVGSEVYMHKPSVWSVMTDEQKAQFEKLKAQSPVIKKVNAHYAKVMQSLKTNYGFPKTILMDLDEMMSGERNTPSTIPVAKYLKLDPNKMWDSTRGGSSDIDLDAMLDMDDDELDANLDDADSGSDGEGEGWWAEGVDEKLEALYDILSGKINDPKISDMVAKETFRLTRLVAKK